jgi:hypothetical protein
MSKEKTSNKVCCLHSSPSKIRMNKSWRMRLMGHVVQMEVKRKAFRLFIGKPERQSPPGRPRCRWVDSIKLGLLEIEWGGLARIALAQERYKGRAIVNLVMNIWVP